MYKLEDTAGGSVEFHTVTTLMSESFFAAVVFEMGSSSFVKRKCPRGLSVSVRQYELNGLGYLVDAKGHFKSLGYRLDAMCGKTSIID